MKQTRTLISKTMTMKRISRKTASNFHGLRGVLHDITKGEEDGEQPPDMDEGSANTAMTVATGDGRRTIAFALPSHPSVLILYRWQGGMSELEEIEHSSSLETT